MKEYSLCYPKSPLIPKLLEIVAGNELEDINIWNKWVKGYAHFYNPYRKVKVCKLGFCRSTSDVRMRMLESLLRNATVTFTLSVGAAVHHLQDMCSPPHVVPVMHGHDDDFEEFENKQYPSISSDCATLNKNYASVAGSTREFLFAMLNRTSIATLNTLPGSVPYMKAGKQANGTWSVLYWQNVKVDADNFGSYGSFGNSYGDTKLTINGTAITVATSVYELYKRNQIRSAIDATKMAFLFADKLKGL